MAITVVDSVNQPQSFAVGGNYKVQLLTYRILSGATSGTVTADALSRIDHILLDAQVKHSAAPTYSSNVATLAFVVPTETAASRTIDGIAYTAVADLGQDGNSITIQIVDGTGDSVPVTPGNEVVQVSASAIVVRIDPTAVTGSSRTQVRAAVNASAAAAALVAATGTSATVASVTAATPLQSGVTGGARGTALCFGI